MDYKEIKGNMITDKPFQIVREFETHFLVKFYNNLRWLIIQEITNL